MKLLHCCVGMAIHLNMLLDQGQHLDLANTKIHVDDGTILEWLDERFKEENDLDLTFMFDDGRSKTVAFFQSMLNAVDARRKLGVENNGLCLLVGYCIEGIQHADDYEDL